MVKASLRYLGRHPDELDDETLAIKLLAFEQKEPYWLPTAWIDPSKL